jgi:putative SOS response-associated peptidase YedK
MCYDISFKVKLEEIADYFPDLIYDEQIKIEWPSFDHRAGIHNFKAQPVIYRHKDDKKLHIRMMEWSCIEYYAKELPDGKKRNGFLNARSERVFGDPKSYWAKIKSKRCLIPLSTTFEHREVLGWPKKVPYSVKPKNQKLFCLPGLYSVWNNVDRTTGEVLESFWTFTIFTRDANDVMRNIHNSGDNPFRMPLFLTLELAMEFISDELTDERYKKILAYSIPSDQLEYYPVNTIRTSKLRADGLEKDQPYDWDGKVPPLGEKNPPFKEKA